MPERPFDEMMESRVGWQSMRVRNLRGFADSGEIEYARLTLLFGKNSSGKTTLLRAPLLLKQAIVASPSNEAALSGQFVDFGSYKEMVYNGEVKRDVRLSAVIASGSADLPPSTMRARPDLADLFARMRVDVDIHWNQRSGYAQYQSVALSNPDTGRKVISFDRSGPKEFEVTMGKDKIVKVPFPLSPQTIRFAEIAFREKNDDDRDSFELSYLMFQLGWALQRSSQRIIHIGPLRDRPRRSYSTDQTGGVQSSIDAIAVLRSGDNIRSIRQAMQTLGLAHSITVKKLAPGFVAVTLQGSPGGRADNLTDVGFGASQVLPILVTLANAEPNTTVLIEQPELHLHPEAQGKLADVLLAFARSRRLRLVIETHSEHILLRLQRRVAETALDPEDLAIYFVDSSKKSTKVSRANVDHQGKVDNSAIPGGFFEDDWEDLLELAKAAGKVRG